MTLETEFEQYDLPLTETLRISRETTGTIAVWINGGSL